MTTPLGFAASLHCGNRSLDDVSPRMDEWVWQDWIPCGTLSLILGEPGVGKSLLGLQLATMVTRGCTRLPSARGNGEKTGGEFATEVDPAAGRRDARSRRDQNSDIARAMSGQTHPRRESPDDLEPGLIARPVAEDGGSLKGEQSSGLTTDQQQLVADINSSHPPPHAQVTSPSTREQPSHSEPDAIANPADPRPGQPSTRERPISSEPIMRRGYRQPAAGFPQPGLTVLFGGGDGDSTVLERLQAAGADMANVILMDRQRRDDVLDATDFEVLKRARVKRVTKAERDRDLRIDLRSLESNLVQLRDQGRAVRLVIIDPIDALLSDSLDKGRLAERLSEIAANTGVAIVAIGLTTSSPNGRCGFRLQTKGMEAFVRTARTVLTIVQDLDNERLKLLLPSKMCLAAKQPGLKFTINAPGVLEWSDETVEVSAEQYLAQAREMLRNPCYKEYRHEVERTSAWLKQRLSQGEALKTQVDFEAGEQDIPESTLKGVFHHMGGIAFKWPHEGKWRLFWRLPAPARVCWTFRSGLTAEPP